jgi:hypothetical protein
MNIKQEMRFRILMAVVFLLGVQFAVFIVLLAGISKNRYDISVLEDKTQILSNFTIERLK